MGIRFLNNESYDSWASRVQMHELLIAKKHIAKGVPVDLVLDRMSKNIAKKLMYPLLKSLKEIPIDMIEFEESRKNYEETYINRVGRAADHVED